MQAAWLRARGAFANSAQGSSCVGCPSDLCLSKHEVLELRCVLFVFYINALWWWFSSVIRINRYLYRYS